MASNTAVYGLCKDRRGIEEVIESLKQGGFRSTDIAVLFPENLALRISLTRRTPRLRRVR